MPKMDANGECRRLQNEELHSLYRSPNTVKEIKSRRVGWAGHIAKMEEGRSVFKISIGKPTGNKSLGKSRRTWNDKLEQISICQR